MTKIVFADNELRSKFQTVICDTIIASKNRNDLFGLMGELATACALYTQNNLLSNKTFSSSFKISQPVATDSKIESIKKTELFGRPHREKINLAEKLGTNDHFADADKMVEPDNSEIPNCPDPVPEPVKPIDPEQITPVWMSENVNLEEYWVYDYSTPCTTLHGNCGCPCAQTELWLVHRRKYKLTIIDAEFVTLDALHDFLDPRKELAAKNKIYPLEKIDSELAGKEEKQHEEFQTVKKQTQFSRFLEYYHQFHGDAAKISAALGILKQSVYAYKNKAKDMGLLK